jgi:hypothetical protein
MARIPDTETIVTNIIDRTAPTVPGIPYDLDGNPITTPASGGDGSGGDESGGDTPKPTTKPKPTPKSESGILLYIIIAFIIIVIIIIIAIVIIKKKHYNNKQIA